MNHLRWINAVVGIERKRGQEDSEKERRKGKGKRTREVGGGKKRGGKEERGRKGGMKRRERKGRGGRKGEGRVGRREMERDTEGSQSAPLDRVKRVSRVKERREGEGRREKMIKKRCIKDKGL